MDHAIYDKRRYPIVDVREGYTEWVRTYEQIVQDEMDLHLLNRLQTIDWSALRLVLDLACGTGRIGQWLKQRGAARIDGLTSRQKCSRSPGARRSSGRCMSLMLRARAARPSV